MTILDIPGQEATRSLDPPERWELVFAEDEDRAWYRGIHDVFPRSPSRAAELPPGAGEELGERCAVEGLRNLFMMPWAVRSTGRGDQKVTTPESVLAVGTRGIGLWTAKPQPGVKAFIPLDRLSAVEDVLVLLYGRLSFVSRTDILTIRYNALGRAGLRRSLLELRERLAGQPLPLPFGGAPGPELPLKWRRLLRDPIIRLRESAPVSYHFAVRPPGSRGDIERGQLLVLNPYELVYMCDPPDASHTYGEDSFVVPRSRITRVRALQRYLEVASSGSRLTLPMEPPLREAAARWFA